MLIFIIVMVIKSVWHRVDGFYFPFLVLVCKTFCFIHLPVDLISMLGAKVLYCQYADRNCAPNKLVAIKVIGC